MDLHDTHCHWRSAAAISTQCLRTPPFFLLPVGLAIPSAFLEFSVIRVLTFCKISTKSHPSTPLSHILLVVLPPPLPVGGSSSSLISPFRVLSPTNQPTQQLERLTGICCAEPMGREWEGSLPSGPALVQSDTCRKCLCRARCRTTRLPCHRDRLHMDHQGH